MTHITLRTIAIAISLYLAALVAVAHAKPCGHSYTRSTYTCHR
jgi:hypothetical protein